MPFPVSGRPGILDPRNPTLLPNFDKPVASGKGTVDHQSPAAFLASNPRVDATGTATLGGTVTPGDTLSLTFSNGLLGNAAFGGSANNAITLSYVTQAGDSLSNVAQQLCDAVNDNASLQNLGLRADAVGGVITVHHNGPAGNLTTLSSAVSGAGTETVTLGNGGVLAGGSGPVLAFNNFTYAFNSVVQDYVAGQPYLIPPGLLALLVGQGMPVV